MSNRFFLLVFLSAFIFGKSFFYFVSNSVNTHQFLSPEKANAQDFTIVPDENERTVTVRPVADTWVMQSQPTTNYNYQNFMRVGRILNSNGPDYARFGLVKFTLPQLPAGSTIISATLKMYIKSLDPQDYTYRQFVAAQPAVRRDWTESQVTFETRPEIGGFFEHGWRPNYIFEEWTVTNIVKDWKEDPTRNPNYGFVIVSNRGDQSYTIEYYTRESAKPPELTITYLLPETIASPIVLPSFTTGFRVSLVPIPSNLWASPSPNANDTTRPDISNLRSTISGNTATFTWQTNEVATTQVWYSVDTRFDHYTPYSGTFETQHSTTISNMAAGTYNFMAVSKDASNNYAYSSRLTFTISQSVATGNEPPDSDGIADDEQELDNGVPDQELTNGDAGNPDIDNDGVLNAADQDIDGDGLANQADEDQDGDGISNDTDSDPDGTNQTSTENNDSDTRETGGNIFERIKNVIEDELTTRLVSARIQSSESGSTALKTGNPFIILSAQMGTNRTVGIALILFSLFLLFIAFIITHVGRKTAHHIRKHLEKQQETERKKDKE